MEDQAAAGLLILDGGARVRKSNATLVKLEDLGVSEGDLANYYNKGRLIFVWPSSSTCLITVLELDRRSWRPIS